MILLAIVSDLHFEFRSFTECLQLRNMMVNSGADTVIQAGDLHPHPEVRKVWEDGILPFIHYLPVRGNHDYYGQILGDCHWTTTIKNHTKVTGATLWTDFNRGDPFVMMDFPNTMYDAKAIQSGGGILQDKIYKLHQFHLDYIAKKKSTIVVTHHSPSLQSIDPLFQNRILQNYYFHSDLDEFIWANQHIKLWVHGHSHSYADYMIGETRVVCNPCGYPSERRDITTYKPLMIEV